MGGDTYYDCYLFFQIIEVGKRGREGGGRQSGQTGMNKETRGTTLIRVKGVDTWEVAPSRA